MPAQITELIDKQDNSEIVRDQIAAILKVEQANQQVLAATAGRDPREWALRIFVERTNPWGELTQDAPLDPLDNPPIVNVTFETASIDAGASNQVTRQKYGGTFNLDVYGYGVGSDIEGGGHIPGDRVAALAAQRGVRLVRNILMSGQYTYLGMARGADQIVWSRNAGTITAFDPAFDERNVQSVIGMRIAFQVDYSEFSPQVLACPISGVSVEVQRDSTGEVVLMDFNATPKGGIAGGSTLSATVTAAP